MKPFVPFRIMVTTDHNTPLSVRTHTTEPVPFAMWGTDIPAASPGAGGFSEAEARAAGVLMPDGASLMEAFVKRQAYSTASAVCIPTPDFCSFRHITSLSNGLAI